MATNERNESEMSRPGGTGLSEGVDRREFLALTGVSTGALGTVGAGAASAATDTDDADGYGMVEYGAKTYGGHE